MGCGELRLYSFKKNCCKFNLIIVLLANNQKIFETFRWLKL